MLYHVLAILFVLKMRGPFWANACTEILFGLVAYKWSALWKIFTFMLQHLWFQISTWWCIWGQIPVLTTKISFQSSFQSSPNKELKMVLIPMSVPTCCAIKKKIGIFLGYTSLMCGVIIQFWKEEILIQKWKLITNVSKYFQI